MMSNSTQTESASDRRTWRRWRWIVGLGGVLIVLWFSRHTWLVWVYNYLDVGQAPRPADFIVMLGGGGQRPTLAAELYHQGYAPRIIVSGCSPTLDDDWARLVEAGVPAEAILVNDHAQSTWNEAQQIVDRLQTEGAESVLIVTDGYHTRRARETYIHLDSSIEVAAISTEGPLTAHTWYNRPYGRSTIIKEYGKIGYYLLRYGVWPW
jgi:uncharacterized SAM-binding protein YcdF (DUF218 family)